MLVRGAFGAQPTRFILFDRTGWIDCSAGAQSFHLCEPQLTSGLIAMLFRQLFVRLRRCQQLPSGFMIAGIAAAGRVFVLIVVRSVHRIRWCSLYSVCLCS